MKLSPIAFLSVAVFCFSILGVGQHVTADSCGCGGPAPNCCGPPVYIHSHCHASCRHCAPQRRDAERRATRDAERDYRMSAPVPVVTSMPVFATPMMFASMPVMPTMATRSATPDTQSILDCEKRMDRLEDNVKQLANAVAELQTIVQDQTAAWRK